MVTTSHADFENAWSSYHFRRRKRVPPTFLEAHHVILLPVPHPCGTPPHWPHDRVRRQPSTRPARGTSRPSRLDPGPHDGPHWGAGSRGRSASACSGPWPWWGNGLARAVSKLFVIR